MLAHQGRRSDSIYDLAHDRERVVHRNDLGERGTPHDFLHSQLGEDLALLYFHGVPV